MYRNFNVKNGKKEKKGEKMAKVNLQEQADKILEAAEKKGVESNFFFITTFKRYQVQMKMLTDLEQSIKAEGPTVEKEYVKGRKNVYVNPALSEYNRTATAANGTVQTLIKIITALDDSPEESGNALAAFLAKGKG